MIAKFLALAAFAATSALATSATAAVTISAFDKGAYNALYGSGTNIGEDFESFGPEGEREVGFVGDPFSTAVGDFVTLGGKGSGGTVKGSAFDNTGYGLALRTGNVHGRSNQTPNGGAWYLDSNDTFGMEWTVKLAGGKAFDRILFTLTDAADQKAFVRVLDGEGGSDELITAADGAVKLVEIVFGSAVTEATVRIENLISRNSTETLTNDGFSVDGLQVAAVPLPAAGLLLATALGGICVAGRRRKAAA